jgi:hypothetical protein
MATINRERLACQQMDRNGVAGEGVDRQHIESLRGRVEVASQSGRGCTFTLRLPLTMAWRRNPYASPAPVIVPEVSSDLQTWASGPGAVDSLLVTSGGGVETWRSVDAGPAGSPQRYLRL